MYTARTIRIAVYYLLAMIAAPAAVSAQPVDSSRTDKAVPVSDAEQPPPVRVIIERLSVPDASLYDTLLVTLEAAGRQIAGFDIKIGIDDHMVSIDEILPGEIPDSCDWEFFDARPSRRAGKEGRPITLWTAVGLAEVIPDSTRVRCYGFDRPASILKLVLSTPPGLLVPDHRSSIFFLWEECGDNSLADKSGGTLYISSSVFDYYSERDSLKVNDFPTRHGAPRRCFSPSAINPPKRTVEFHNGGLEFILKLDQPTDSVDSLK